MDIVFHRHFGRLFGCLKHGADVHVETQVGKGRGNDLDTPVMTILPHFCHQNSGTPAFPFHKIIGPFSDGCKDFAVTILGRIHPGNTLGGCNKPAEYRFHGIGYFTHRCTRPNSGDTGLQKIAICFGRLFNIGKRLLNRPAVSAGLYLHQPLYLLVTNRL